MYYKYIYCRNRYTKTHIYSTLQLLLATTVCPLTAKWERQKKKKERERRENRLTDGQTDRNSREQLEVFQFGLGAQRVREREISLRFVFSLEKPVETKIKTTSRRKKKKKKVWWHGFGVDFRDGNPCDSSIREKEELRSLH